MWLLPADIDGMQCGGARALDPGDQGVELAGVETEERVMVLVFLLSQFQISPTNSAANS